MRTYGSLHPTDLVPVPPDTVSTLLLAAGVAQAMDWATSTGALATARAGNIDLVRLTGMSTNGVPMGFNVNLQTTGAIAPTSGTTAGSTGISHPVLGQGTFQVPGGSTGFSVAASAAGYVMAEVWSL